MDATYYHPDPETDAQVRAMAAEAQAFDVAHGIAKPGDCIECGWANNPDLRRRCRNCGAPLPDSTLPVSPPSEGAPSEGGKDGQQP